MNSSKDPRAHAWHVAGGSLTLLAGSHALTPAILTRCAGVCAAVLGLWQTGLVAAVPAAVGLTALASSDFTSHRFSLHTLRVATGLVAAGLLVEAIRSSAWGQLAATVAVACLVLFAALALWLSSGGIALGDVLLLAFTVLVPAWLSPRAVWVTVLVALIVGGGVAVLQRRERPACQPAEKVALGPALLVGWMVAVVVG